MPFFIISFNDKITCSTNYSIEHTNLNPLENVKKMKQKFLLKLLMFYFITETPPSLKVTNINYLSQRALQLQQNW